MNTNELSNSSGKVNFSICGETWESPFTTKVKALKEVFDNLTYRGIDTFRLTVDGISYSAVEDIPATFAAITVERDVKGA
jgi:hypothetical protein